MRLAALMLTILVLAACSTTGSNDAGADSGPVAQPAQAADAPKETYEATNYYMDFADVLLPVELKYDADESFVFETRQQRTGFMKFSGRVDALSLFEFFAANMVKDGWTKIFSTKAKESLLLFEKPGKSARIKITDAKFSTKVDVLVVEMR